LIDDFGTFKGTDAEFRADVCIIGSGVAGITVARQLRDSGLDVCLLESGGTDFERRVQDLADGTTDGFPYYELAKARLRFFGGTTAVWGGRVAQLDAIDFEKRGWLPFSGWPFGKEELRPYYRGAQALHDLSPMDDNSLSGFKSPFNEGILQTAFWQFDETFDRFTVNRCGDLVGSSRVRILLHATALELQVDEEGGAVASVRIANLDGGRGAVRARAFVLATGGLEVPRLLLASRSPAHPAGLGNDEDLVGRFFMEHPHARGARIFPADPKRLFRLLPRFTRIDGRRYGMLFRLGEERQERDGLLNTAFALAIRRYQGEKQHTYKRVYNWLRHEVNPTQRGRFLWKLTRRASIRTQDSLGLRFDTFKLNRSNYGIYAVIRAEQAPNRESRVTLSEDRDALGMQKLSLHWRLSEIDRRSAQGAMRALADELTRLELGRTEPAAWLGDANIEWEVDPVASNHAIGGYHHMGTARMAHSPREGVVDADGRVHGVANCFVAGSAVFPTGGWANPNLTISALAIRLAEHLHSFAQTGVAAGKR
jgi:choline dehydrogenase-like flavoprotein